MANTAAILEERVFAVFRSQQKLLHIPCLASGHTTKRRQATRQFNPGFSSQALCLIAFLPDSQYFSISSNIESSDGF